MTSQSYNNPNQLKVNNMKKINIFLFLLLTITLQSCLKDDKERFPISASARMEQRLIENGEVLTNAPNGWLMKYYPESNQIYGGYNIFVKFDADNKVSVMTERGGSQAQETSLYSLCADNGPVLRFDTHNSLFHYYSEPLNEDGIGPQDGGMLGDYEFTMFEVTAEKVVLRGKKTGNTIIMVPLAAGESNVEKMNKLLQTDADTKGYSAYEYTVNGAQASVVRDFRNMSFTYQAAGEDVTFSEGYIVTEDGLEFYEPITLGGVEVSSMVFHYDAEHPYFEDPTTQARLTIVAPPLSSLLVNGQWYFSIKNMGTYGQEYWTRAYEEKMKPKGLIMRTVFLGRDGNSFGISYRGALEGYDPIPGMYNFNYELVDGNTFRTYWNGTGSGTYVVYGFLYKMNLVLQAF